MKDNFEKNIKENTSNLNEENKKENESFDYINDFIELKKQYENQNENINQNVSSIEQEEKKENNIQEKKVNFKELLEEEIKQKNHSIEIKYEFDNVINNDTKTSNLLNEFLQDQEEESVIKARVKYNLLAESGILASLLIDSSLCMQIDDINKEDFFVKEHAFIFHAIKTLFNQNSSIDASNILNFIQNEFKINSKLIEERLFTIIDLSVSSLNFHLYKKIILNCSLSRKIMKIGHELITLSFSEDTKQIVENTEKKLFELLNKKNQKDYFFPGSINLNILEEWHKQLSEEVIYSGFSSLDKILIGFRKTEVSVIAARPGVGKTALAISLAVNMSKQKKNILFFSLEMSHKQLMYRILSNITEISLSNFFSPNELNELHKNEINKALINLQIDNNITIIDIPNICFSELKSICRSLYIEKTIDVIIIDYIQLIKTTQVKNDNLHIEMSMLTKELKALARELEVPIIILSQLSRNTEQSKSRRPNLWHIRTSGSIEEHFDNIMLLYREDYYQFDKEFNEENKVVEEDNFDKHFMSKTEVIVAKHRNGVTGIAYLNFLSNLSKFDNIR